MTFLYFIAWLLSGTPHLDYTGAGAWNTWSIALAVCIAIDVLGSGSKL